MWVFSCTTSIPLWKRGVGWCTCPDWGTLITAGGRAVVSVACIFQGLYGKAVIPVICRLCF